VPQAKLDNFNNAIDLVISNLNDACGLFNCLNVTHLPPSARNGAINNNCVSWGGGRGWQSTLRAT
jgi:hypothetical protein